MKSSNLLRHFTHSAKFKLTAEILSISEAEWAAASFHTLLSDSFKIKRVPPKTKHLYNASTHRRVEPLLVFKSRCSFLVVHFSELCCKLMQRGPGFTDETWTPHKCDSKQTNGLWELQESVMINTGSVRRTWAAPPSKVERVVNLQFLSLWSFHENL